VSEPQTSDPRGLSAGREVSLIDAIAQSVGFMGPVFSIALLVPLVAGANPAASGAGVAAPLSVLLAVVGAFAIAWIVAAHARRADRPGSLHDQIGTALGAPLGAASGLLHLAGVIVLGAGLVVKIGGSIFDVLDQEFALTPLTQTTWMLVVLVLLALMLSLNLKVTTRVLLVLVTVSVLVVLLFVLNVIVRAGGQNDVVTAFSPSSSPQGIGGVLLGLLYAVPLLFLGLESAVGLGAETTHPERDLPRAVLVAVAVVGTLAVLGSYAQVVGYELNLDMITDNRSRCRPPGDCSGRDATVACPRRWAGPPTAGSRSPPGSWWSSWTCSRSSPGSSGSACSPSAGCRTTTPCSGGPSRSGRSPSS
jgi:amino acid transporter